MQKGVRRILCDYKYLVCLMWIIFFHCMSYNSIGYYVDEIGAMYDAYSISNFGVDRWLDSYPIHFKNYGDGQCAIFTYILAILFKIFGYSKVVVRSVPLFFHIIAVIFISKIAGLYDKKLENVCFILCTVLPVLTLLFHFGLESHFMLSLCAVFLYFLLRGVQQKNVRDFIISGFFAGLTFYTYVLSYIVIPVFILLFFGYLTIRKQVNIKQVIAFTIPVIFFGFPLLVVMIINIFDFNQVVIGGITFPKFLVYRGNELSFRGLCKNIYDIFLRTNFYNKAIHTCIPAFGNIYYISIPFLILGFCKHLKEVRKNHISAAIVLWTISMYFLGGLLDTEALNNTRLNALYLSKFVFIATGIEYFSSLLKKWEKEAKYGVLILYILSFLCFNWYYFSQYDLEMQCNLFREDYSDLPELKEEVYLPDNYVYFLWSKKINPYDFNLNENGYFQYKNYHMGYDELNYGGIYVIYENDYVSQDTLDRLGFTHTEVENYYLYFFERERQGT